MFSMLVIGNVDACRTEVEISTGTGVPVAILYEDLGGWQLERLSGMGNQIPQSFIEEAKAHLRLYRNRTGANAPLGLTRTGGLALWLMTKVDGTAMGLPAD